MLKEVLDFLETTRESDQCFEQLIDFMHFRDKVIHKQYFEDIISDLYEWFNKKYMVDDITITTYDIENFKEIRLISVKDSFDPKDSCAVSYDFSKSYEINGRMFLKFKNIDHKLKAIEDDQFLQYIFYELKPVLRNYITFKKLKDASYTDDVTSLPNRKFLIKHLNAMFNVVKQEHLELAFLKVDIDRYKAVLEEFNHEIGNKVLQTVAKSINKHIGQTDIVTKFEESSFMICMQDVKDESLISKLAQNIIDDFASKFVIVDTNTNQKLYKTVSVGISIHPTDGIDLDDLFKKSDIALDEAKNKGRGSYEFYKEEQNSMLDLF